METQDITLQGYGRILWTHVLCSEKLSCNSFLNRNFELTKDLNLFLRCHQKSAFTLEQGTFFKRNNEIFTVNRETFTVDRETYVGSVMTM